jgi:hypothetical protein
MAIRRGHVSFVDLRKVQHSVTVYAKQIREIASQKSDCAKLTQQLPKRLR